MLDWLWAIYKPVTIHMDPSVCCFAPQNWKILVSGSFREFTNIERVILPARLQAMLSIDVQVNLTARFRVNIFAALSGVNDGVISPAQVRAMLPVDFQVMLPACFQMNMFDALPGVNDGMISSVQAQAMLPACFRVFAALSGVNDGVISPAQAWAMLPTDVLVMLPTRFRVNMFAALLVVDDGVFSPAQNWAMLPTHFWVNLYTTLWVNMFTMPLSVDDGVISPVQVQTTLHANLRVNPYNNTLQWVNDAHSWVCDKVIQAICSPVVLPAQIWVNKFMTHSQINSVTAYSWVNEFVHFGWLNNKSVVHVYKSECAEYYVSVDQVNGMMAYIQISIAVHASVNAYSVVQGNESAVTPALFECGDYFNSVQLNGHVSIWRHPTANYNVTSYPYFVFHLKQFEFSSFSETFKGYAYHVLQYRLIHVIEFAFCWSNHICHFMLQNMTMLVDFDLTPQQYCQKLHLTMCQSHFYKHDFAVISPGPGPSIHYVVINYMKYLENIICQIIQHKYLHKMSIWSSAKKDSKSQITNFFEPPEHNPSGKIEGGQHGPIKQKIENGSNQTIYYKFTAKF